VTVHKLAAFFVIEIPTTSMPPATILPKRRYRYRDCQQQSHDDERDNTPTTRICHKLLLLFFLFGEGRVVKYN